MTVKPIGRYLGYDRVNPSDAAPAAPSPEPAAPEPAPDHAMPLNSWMIPRGGVLTLSTSAQVRLRVARLVAFRRRPCAPPDAREPHRWPIAACYLADAFKPAELLYDGGFDFGTLEVAQHFTITVRNDGDEDFEFSGYLLGTRLPARWERPSDDYQLIGSPPSIFTAERLAEIARPNDVFNTDDYQLDEGEVIRRQSALAAHQHEPVRQREIDTGAVLLRCRHCGEILKVLHVCADCGAEVTEADGASTRHGAWHCAGCAAKHDGWEAQPAAPPLTPTVTYCEAAPPRELVEATPVVHDGDEVGAVALSPASHVRGHLVFSQSLAAAWARHEDYRRSFGVDEDGDDEYASPPALPSSPVDPPPPAGADAFGGVAIRHENVPGEPFGMRCQLCGGWIRRAPVRL